MTPDPASPLPTDLKVEASAKFDIRGTIKAYDLRWWCARLPEDAEVSITNYGEAITARWRL